MRKLDSLRSQTRGHKDWVLLNVTTATPKRKRERIRRQLGTQQCRRRYKSILLLATSVFESSITLEVNGVINSGLATTLDHQGFLNVTLCNPAQHRQRRDRATASFASARFPSERIPGSPSPPGWDTHGPLLRALSPCSGPAGRQRGFQVRRRGLNEARASRFLVAFGCPDQFRFITDSGFAFAAIMKFASGLDRVPSSPTEFPGIPRTRIVALAGVRECGPVASRA